MKHDKETIGSVRSSLPADRLLASVGIPLLINSEVLFNGCDDLDAQTLLEVSSELYILSAVLAALCTQHERTLKTLTVELPEEVGAMSVKNPLYQPKTEEPLNKSNGSTSETEGDFPF